MQRKRSNLLRVGVSAVLLCLFGIAVSLHWNREPSYEGHPLGYWLDRLEPTIITPANEVRKSIYFEVRNKTAGIMLTATTDYMNGAIRKHASRVIEKAGPECLPFLIARLKVKDTPRPVIALRRLAYTLRLVDSVPMFDSYSDVQRGQAVTAILLLGGRAPPIEFRCAFLASHE